MLTKEIISPISHTGTVNKGVMGTMIAVPMILLVYLSATDFGQDVFLDRTTSL